MSESDVITMSFKEDFQCSRSRAPRGMRGKVPNAEVRPLHESIVKIPQRASGFDGVGEIYQI